ncbi:MAG: metallophosphoesterase, partial [Alphaproteobacteria bacterium]|nr:metallophosphoesterase [Alphaproteobacteria bacterium]
MPVLVALGILVLAIIAILYKTLVGYGEYHWWTKLLVLLLLTISLGAPFINFNLRNYGLTGIWIYLPKVLYFLFGYTLLLFIMMILRDVIWWIIDLVSHTPVEEMKNSAHLQKANIITIIFCLLFCFYGVYEAEKNPNIITHNLTSSKIKKPTKIVMLNDLHIDKNVSPKRIRQIVERVNAQNPDAIVLVGDTVEISPEKLAPQMVELKKLKAKDNVYFTLGNHEFYAGAFSTALNLSGLGFVLLNNSGFKMDGYDVFMAGIPDIDTAQNHKMGVRFKNAIYGAAKDDYVILLSHAPKLAEDVSKDNIDLQLSGHTHGGQIYPFHYF